jgi:hypothetical protein
MSLNQIPIFQKIRTGITLVDRVIEKLYETLSALTGQEIINGQLIGPVALVSGDNKVNHQLGRAINGYIVVRLSASATIYDKESTNTARSSYMIIHASANATAYFWVF